MDSNDTDSSSTLYGYTPSSHVSVLFVFLFGISTIVHLVQAIRNRMWFLLPTAAMCGIGETIGWSGRLWSSKNVNAVTPFLMQSSSTILAPTFFSAANFITLDLIVERVGRRFSYILPKYYAVIFIGADLAALTVQAVGGEMASSTIMHSGNPDKGGHVMLAGIVIQLVALVVYVAFAASFVFHASSNKPVRRAPPPYSQEEMEMKPEPNSGLTPSMKTVMYGLAFSTLLLFIRAVYRTIELSNGWGGRIIQTQVYFNVCDGAMVVLAMYTLNILHPKELLYDY
ncbi:hypothetical protein BS47DRAFT_1339671 [Hydnum rufescens UP504]|uniref:RTA1-domain-containing protein n=1 Tax=Hydnum rufescens UP504 TaxID=1448309 RepID=A0A9P6B4X6_9AGAM|nr:hypothetical protein BS47DRAFT_1339671 [Hydnum rufescens UP504]